MKRFSTLLLICLFIFLFSCAKRISVHEYHQDVEKVKKQEIIIEGDKPTKHHKRNEPVKEMKEKDCTEKEIKKAEPIVK